MAGAEIIGAAVGVLLLILVGYFLIGSALTTAEVVTTAQKDISMQNDARLQTAIIINYLSFPTGNTFEFSLNNTGSESIKDFPHMDIFSYESSLGYQRYTYTKSSTANAGEWTIIQFDRDFVHPNMLDPGEAVWICATYSLPKPVSLLVSTSNGVVTSKPIF